MKKTRLKKLKEKEDMKMTKTASYSMSLDSMSLSSGDLIELNLRYVNNKPWYQIKHEHEWESSSFYDGPDSKRAFQLYSDLLCSFKNISSAEKFVKSIPMLLEKINKFSEQANTSGRFQDYHNLIQKKPSFLGF